MNKRTLWAISLALALLVPAALANPIPPHDARMPLEDMYCELSERPPDDIVGQHGLWAGFNGHYHFSYISPEIGYMTDPLHEDFLMDSLSVAFNGDPLDPYLIRSVYPTALEEMPWVPMIAWRGKFPEDGGIFSVKFQHPLLRRSHNCYTYFYAMGTGKCWPPETYQKNCLAYLDMTMPPDWCVRRMWLAVQKGNPDFLPHPYSVTTENGKTVVSMFANYYFGEFQRDVVARVRRWRVAADCNFDGIVNVADLLTVRNNLGKSVISPTEDADVTADVNGDGIVNVADLLTVRNELGAGTEDEEDAQFGPPPPVLRYKVGSECSSDWPSEPLKPTLEVRDRRLYISHKIQSNCCSEYIRTCLYLEGNRIIFRFKVKEEAPCDCICFTPMKGVAGVFEPGTYTVDFYECLIPYNPGGKLVHSQEITIE